MSNLLARKLLGTFVVGAVASAAIVVVMPNAAFAGTDDTVTASEVNTALNSAGDLVADPAQSVTDADSAAVASSNGTTVDVPKNPDAGVTLSADGALSIKIELPNADDAANAKRLADGTIVYPGTDGSANAVVPTDSGVQMITTIANPDAPTRYDYKVNVAEGGQVVVTGDVAIVYDSSMTPQLSISTPWAKDVNGKDVATHFETDGTKLVQVVDHKNGDYQYPITADPWVTNFWNYVKCIVGVGAPIGAAIAIAMFPATWPIAIGWAYGQSAQGGKPMVEWVNRTYRSCRAFIRS